VPDDSVVRFRRVVSTALAELERRREEVNDLNVFPVADGDTGDNMAMTMRAVLDELDRINGQPLDEFGRDELVAAVARAALLGARGNSGVILSQIVRGAAEELASRRGELVDPVLVSAAFARAADAAYASVREPAEGTMLSAVRAMARRVAHDLAHMDVRRLGPDSGAGDQDALLAEVLENALEAAKEAVERGPEELAILREAGVVDAGAYGLTIILAGCIAALRGRTPPELPHQSPPAESLHLPQHASSSYRYCTNFAVTGEGLERGRFVPRLEELGDCVLVVGDELTLRVHVHTDEPERAVALFEAVGELSRFDVADMHEQVAERSTRRRGDAAEITACAVVAVASGDGLRRLYEELGALVVDGGPTMSPSTYELLAGIHAASGSEVLVLPNSPNVILAAERAVELSEKPARLVATSAPQEGLAALVAFDPGCSGAENAEALYDAAATLRLGGVAPSARDDPGGRFRAAEALGYAEAELVAFGESRATLRTTLERVAAGAELLTCIAGADAPLGREEVEALVPGGVELEYHWGGQPAWWWLLCAE
jgi:uncharacterized protein